MRALALGSALTAALTLVALPASAVPPPPVVSHPNGITRDSTPDISGTAEAGATISVFMDGIMIGATPAAADGTWSFPTDTLSDGSYLVTATATNFDVTSSESSPASFVIDTTAPAAPVTVTPADGSTTTDSTPTVTGTAEANTTVTVVMDAIPIGTPLADEGGTWVFTAGTPLGDGSHTVRATATDSAGNSSPTSNTNTFTVDTLRPTATVVVSDTALSIGETATVTIAFSEPVMGLSSADLWAANATLSDLAPSDGGVTWTATLTPAASTTDASNLVTLDLTGVADVAGNAGTGRVDSNDYVIDTVRPTATVVVFDTALSVGETATVTITFAEPVTGFTSADLWAVNATLSGLASSDGGVTWTAKLTPSVWVTDSTNVVSLDLAGVADLAGNAGTGTVESSNFAIDTVRPTATVVVSDTALAAGETATVTITFSEAVTGFTSADLAADNATLSGLASADGGKAWTATLTPSASVADRTNVVSLALAGVTDVAGNAGTGTVESSNFAIDTVRPTATVVVSDSALSVGETATVTITFTEPVTGLSSGDLTVPNATLSGLASSDGGVTWTAMLTPAASTTDASNVVSLDLTGVTNGAGNAGTGTVDSDDYAIDTVRPTATVVVSDTVLRVGETAVLTVTFSESVTGFTSADLAAAHATLSGVSSADGGTTWTATLTAASVTDPTSLVALHLGGVTDLAGNIGTGTVDSNSYSIHAVPPPDRDVVAPVSEAASAARSNATTWTVTYAAFDDRSGLASVDLYARAPGQLTFTRVATDSTDQDGTFSFTGTTDGAYGFYTRATDRVGNVETAPASPDVTTILDTAGPTAMIVVTDDTLGAGETTPVTITFSEAVTGLTPGDLTAGNAVLSSLASSDSGVTWAAVLTPAATTTAANNVVTLSMTGVSDASGNTGTGTAASNTYTIDTVAPVVVPRMGRLPLRFDISADAPLVLRFRVTESASIQLEIVRRGSTVRTFRSSDVAGGMVRQPWSGRGDAGQRVPSGRYHAVFVAQDLAGNRAEVRVPLRVTR